MPRSAPVPLQLSGFHPQPKAAASPQDSDFSRQMMSALDKYSRLQTDRGAARSGSVLDLSH